MCVCVCVCDAPPTHSDWSLIQHSETTNMEDNGEPVVWGVGQGIPIESEL